LHVKHISNALAVKCSNAFSLSSAAGLQGLIGLINEGVDWVDCLLACFIKIDASLTREYWYRAALTRAFVDRYNKTPETTPEIEEILAAVPAKCKANSKHLKDLKYKIDAYKGCYSLLVDLRTDLEMVKRVTESLYGDIRKLGEEWVNKEGVMKAAVTMKTIDNQWGMLQFKRSNIAQIEAAAGELQARAFDHDVFCEVNN
jgi:hypothetical protein